ncbi:MAG: NMD3-related protein [Thermoplasmataceae archaeon]
MICINCGKNNSIERGLCEECITAGIKVNTPGVYEITICPKCESTMVGKKWVQKEGKPLFEKKFLESISINDPKSSINKSDSSIRINSYKGTASLFLVIQRENIKGIHLELEVPYKVRKISCPSCNKATGSYYEGKIQLRGFQGETNAIMEHVLNYILKRIDEFSKKNNDSFVSQVEKQVEGYDIYLGRKNDSDRVCRELSKEYFSSLNVSKSLAGMKEGHEIYRYTYALRIMDLQKGAILDLNGKEFLMKRVSSQFLYLVETGKKIERIVKRTEFFSSRIVNRGLCAEKRRMIKISESNGESFLMDSVNFSQIVLKEEIDEPEIDIFVYMEEYYRL